MSTITWLFHQTPLILTQQPTFTHENLFRLPDLHVKYNIKTSTKICILQEHEEVSVFNFYLRSTICEQPAVIAVLFRSENVGSHWPSCITAITSSKCSSECRVFWSTNHTLTEHDKHAKSKLLVTRCNITQFWNCQHRIIPINIMLTVQWVSADSYIFTADIHLATTDKLAVTKPLS